MNKFIAILLSVGILAGCQTIDSAVSDAQELQTKVTAKVAEIQAGIENVTTEAKTAYSTLLEKKQQLEEMVAEINEAVNSINKLLGTEKTPAEAEDLQTTISELKLALAAAEEAIGEVEQSEETATAEEALTEEIEEPTESETTEEIVAE